MIYDDETLRYKVKELKVYNNISYQFFAEILDMKKNSFYNFINGACNLGSKRKQLLSEFIDRIKGD